jgi:hypothetical protein
MLLNILDSSAEIREGGYKCVCVCVCVCVRARARTFYSSVCARIEELRKSILRQLGITH